MTENNPTNNNQNNQPSTIYYCDSCQQNKTGTYIKRKVDAPFEPRMHKRVCYICPVCSPYVKEYNEAQDRDKDDNPYRQF